jgi:hypothetical protein
MIDLRSNPAARQQVQTIVRRAAAQQAPPAPAQAPAPAPAGATFPAAPEQSTAQRLQELETLRATGAISDDEYTAKRQQIISSI